MKKVAGLGIANIDIIFSNACRMPGLGEEIYSKECCRQLGGGPVATMIQLARLGVPVKLATYMGTGELSRFLKEELKKNNTEYLNLLETDEPDPVTLSCVVSCSQDRGIISYRPKDKVFSVSEDRIYDFYRDSKIAYLSLEQRGLCKRLKEAGCVIVLDSAWSDKMNLDWYYDVFPYVDYFIPNEPEAMKITGAGNGEEALEILGRYLKTPVVKRGNEGCIYKKGDEVGRVPPVPVKHVDSTGAGDAFAAGFLYGIYYGYSIEECIRFGNITGGNAVTQVGCLTAEMSEAELLGYKV